MPNSIHEISLFLLFLLFLLNILLFSLHTEYCRVNDDKFLDYYWLFMFIKLLLFIDYKSKLDSEDDPNLILLRWLEWLLNERFWFDDDTLWW